MAREERDRQQHQLEAYIKIEEGTSEEMKTMMKKMK